MVPFSFYIPRERTYNTLVCHINNGEVCSKPYVKDNFENKLYFGLDLEDKKDDKIISVVKKITKIVSMRNKR